MSKADEIKAGAKKVSQARQQQAAEQPAKRKPAGQNVRTKLVRRTVDLPPVRHAELDQWCSETARQLGQARVTGQAVISTLVARLLTDETLARKIRQDLSANQ